MIKIIIGSVFFLTVFSIFFGNAFFGWSNLYMGILILIYFVLQIIFAIGNQILYKKISNKEYKDIDYPTISFNIVGYREDPVYWEKCLESIKHVDYPKDKLNCICAVVDGDKEEDVYMKEMFEEIFNDYETYFGLIESKTKCILLEHGGKRSVMYHGFKYIKNNYPSNQYIIVIDSDTILKKDSVKELVKGIDWNDLNGCGTGSLKIFNRKNLLTRIVHSRYGFAFDIERGAMSFVGCMNCCSGPFSIYRQELLDNELLDYFLYQKYCEVRVGPGDDRHLTNLILYKGYRSIQTSHAIAYTESPEMFKRFVLQQLRWSRSFYRELIWQIRAIPKQHCYLIVITTYETLFPFFILLSIMSQLYIEYPLSFILRRVIYAVGILVIRTLMLMIFKRGDIKYLFNICYFPMYFLLLLPVKMYALCTCYKMGWVTSDRKNLMFLYNTVENFLILGFVGIWIGMLVWCVLQVRHETLTNPFETYF